MPAPEFPSRPVSELVTPETYVQEFADGFSYLSLYAIDVEAGGLCSTRTRGAVAGERGSGMQPIDGTDLISAKRAYFFNEFRKAVRAIAKLVARGFEQRAGVDSFNT